MIALSTRVSHHQIFLWTKVYQDACFEMSAACSHGPWHSGLNSTLCDAYVLFFSVSKLAIDPASVRHVKIRKPYVTGSPSSGYQITVDGTAAHSFFYRGLVFWIGCVDSTIPVFLECFKKLFSKKIIILNWSIQMSNPREIKRYPSTNQIEYFKKRILPAIFKEGTMIWPGAKKCGNRGR